MIQVHDSCQMLLQASVLSIVINIRQEPNPKSERLGVSQVVVRKRMRSDNCQIMTTTTRVEGTPCYTMSCTLMQAVYEYKS